MLVRRRGGEIDYVRPSDVDYMDVSPRQMVSVATAMIPFLEHDDANRALMGAEHERQAVPLDRARPRSSAPAWSTAAPSTPATWSRRAEGRCGPGGLRGLHHRRPTTTARTPRTALAKFPRSNQGTSRQPEGRRRRGRPGSSGQVLADGPSTDEGEMALGQQPARGVHAVGGSQLRGRDHPVAAPRAGRRPLLDPHRGARGRRP